jgi:Mind bomb SH3 repeat domain
MCDQLKQMKYFQALGKIGKVTKVYDDGDLRVTVDGQTWTLNPLCLTPLPGSATELHNTMAASIRQEHISRSFESLLLFFFLEILF